MTIIEQIKTEIERQEKQCPLDTYEGRHKLFILGGLKTFISTLESEKPMNSEERICSYDIVPYIDDKIAALQDMWREEKVAFDWDDMHEMIEDVARHFAKWGAEHFRDTTKKIEPPCHTVEEWIEHIKNADQLTKDIFSMGPYDVLYDALNRPYRDCYDAIKEFGELCYQTARQDMMEEAVVYVAEPETPIGNILMPFIRIDHSVLFRYGIKVGDKVRIIIVKED